MSPAAAVDTEILHGIPADGDQLPCDSSSWGRAPILGPEGERPNDSVVDPGAGCPDAKVFRRWCKGRWSMGPRDDGAVGV